MRIGGIFAILGISSLLCSCARAEEPLRQELARCMGFISTLAGDDEATESSARKLNSASGAISSTRNMARSELQARGIKFTASFGEVWTQYSTTLNSYYSDHDRYASEIANVGTYFGQGIATAGRYLESSDAKGMATFIAHCEDVNKKLKK